MQAQPSLYFAALFVTARFFAARFFVFLPAACGLGGCTGGEEPECASQADCGTTTAPCDNCGAEGESLCLEGSCADRGDDATSLTIAILRIDPRQLEVSSLVWVAADATSPAGAFACAEALSAQLDSFNVLSSGFINLSGGAQHTDVTVGRVPEGSFGLILLGLDDDSGQGSVIARTCLGPFEASGTDYTFDLVTLNGL